VTVFLGTFENKVDRKGRVSVPSAFRDAIADQSFHGIVGFPSYRHPAIECCGMDLMADLGETMTDHDLFSDDHDDLATTIFADCQQLAFDGQGRVMLPQPFMEHAGIQHDAAFVGKGKLFQIWDPKTLEDHKKGARQRAKERGLTLSLKPGQAHGGSAP